MKNKLAIVVLLFALQAGKAQDKYADSLNILLNSQTNNSDKIATLSLLTTYYINIYPDSAITKADEIINLARKANNPVEESLGYYYKGFAFDHLANYTNALQAALKCLEIAESIPAGQFLIKAKAYELLGHLYGITGDSKQSLIFYQKSIEFINQHGGPREEFYTLYGRLANRLMSTQPDSAIHFAKFSYQYAMTIPKKQRSVYPYLVLSNVYNSIGKIDSAKKYILDGIIISRENNSIFYLTVFQNNYSKYLLSEGKIDSSINYARQSLYLAQKYKYKLFEINAAQSLFRAYENKNTDSAFKYMKQMVLIKDEVFSQQNGQQFQLISSDEQLRKRDLEDQKKQFIGKVKLYALLGILSIFLLLAFILYRHNIQKQKAYDLLQGQKQETDNQKQKVESALEELKATQIQLFQFEKMASLGELTAGIAHEIQNPLNFVNNFSEINAELLDELKEELTIGNKQQAIEIVKNIKQNSEKINHHGKRADGIVKGMLQHSQSTQGIKEPTNINKLADEYLRLAYHGLKAKDKTFNSTMKTDFDETIGNINIIPQDIGRVILNLLNNAFYTVNERNVEVLKHKSGEVYVPTVSVSTKKTGDKISISVKDNGNGIPDNIKDKILQPFFTTKPSGQGTGLGLSLAYDTIKAHGGIININSSKEGSTFQILLPMQ
ncbi:MAG: ATP-binding protein [Saprospiraceae bacterium]